MRRNYLVTKNYVVQYKLLYGKQQNKITLNNTKNDIKRFSI